MHELSCIAAFTSVERLLHVSRSRLDFKLGKHMSQCDKCALWQIKQMCGIFKLKPVPFQDPVLIVLSYCPQLA